jgi:hypothetical protein
MLFFSRDQRGRRVAPHLRRSDFVVKWPELFALLMFTIALVRLVIDLMDRRNKK